MADNPTSWGAISVAESPASWGAIPATDIAPQLRPGEVPFKPYSGNNFEDKKIGERVFLGETENGGFEAIKASDNSVMDVRKYSTSRPPSTWLSNEIVKTVHPEDASDEYVNGRKAGGPVEAVISGFVRGVPGSFGGVTGMAASAPLANALRPIPRIGPLLSGGVTLGSGVLGSILAGLGNEKIHPTSQEEAKLVQENPYSSMAGGIGANALFFKPGLALEAVNRLKAASIGGGIQGVSELVNAPEGQVVGEGATKRTLEAMGINALFNNPTKLSESILGPANPAAVGAKKTKSSAIIDSLGNASTKSSLPETTAASNDIALGSTKPLDVFSQIDQTTGKSAVESASVFPESTIPIKSAADSAKILERTSLPGELAPSPPAQKTTLGELIGQSVEYAGETGKLIRDDEGNFLIVRDIQGPGKAPFVEIADTGKDPLMVASDIGVISKLAKDSANYSENRGPAINYGDLQPNPRPVGGRFKPNEPINPIEIPVVEQMPVKPTETPITAEPVQSKEDYLKELLDSKEITKEEYDTQLKGVKTASGVDPTELPAAIKHLTGLAKKGIAGLNDRLNERVAAVETARAIANSHEDVAPTRVLDDSNPNYAWKPWISRLPGGKALKKTIGIIDENLGAISPRLMGGVRSREFDLSDKRTKWNEATLPFAQELRKSVSPEEFQALDLAIQNGQHESVVKALDTLPNGKDLIASFQKAKASLGEQLYESKIVGRDVGEIENYWPRRVHDYKGLRAELGRPEQGVLDQTIMAKQKELGRPLTDSEKAELLNQAISLQLKGKPGFLKPRTIESIKQNYLKFYEPFDVAMEDHINRVSKDVVNRKYLGKAEFAAEEPIGGDLGKILSEELESNPSFKGNNGAEAEQVVLDNLRDHLREETAAGNAIAKVGNAFSRATNFLHLGDVSSAIAQFADVFNHIHNYGFKNALKGSFDPIAAKTGLTKDHNIKLNDVGIHEGHAETSDYSRSEANSRGKRFVDSIVKNTVGLADRVNKEAGLNSARHAFYDAVRDHNSNDFIKLNDKWSKRFPERWPEIMKDLQSKDFSEGKLNDNTRFFLYNELADIQPISMAQRAQIENASPASRFLYSLKRYWVKQLNVMRAQGYEKLKNPDTFWQGAKDLTSYAVIVGGGSAVAVGLVRDLLFGRDPEPEDYALGGLTQLAGVTKYNIHQARQDGIPTAIMSFAFPLAADVKDLGLDAGLAFRSLRGDYGTPNDPLEFAMQARTTKNIPYVGREIYNWFGRGRSQEDKRQLEKLQGKSQPNTLEEIELLLSPPEKKK